MRSNSKPVTHEYLGGEGSAFLRKRKTGELPWEEASTIRCHQELKDRVLVAAQRRGMSVSKFIERSLCKEWFINVWLEAGMSQEEAEILAEYNRQQYYGEAIH